MSSLRVRRLAAVCMASTALAFVALGPARAAQRTTPSISFFSGGGGAHADWLHTDDQPAGDTDSQAIRVVDTADPSGYAGFVVHHADGQPTASYPPSSFDFKASQAGSSLGYPRLVYVFSDGGNASLRPLTWTTDWQTVSDNNWDNNAGGCGFQFQKTWSEIQACHPGTTVTAIFFTTDPGIPVEFLVDNLNTAGKRISNASDNTN